MSEGGSAQLIRYTTRSLSRSYPCEQTEHSLFFALGANISSSIFQNFLPLALRLDSECIHTHALATSSSASHTCVQFLKIIFFIKPKNKPSPTWTAFVIRSLRTIEPSGFNIL